MIPSIRYFPKNISKPWKPVGWRSAVNIYTIGLDVSPKICIALVISPKFLTGYNILERIVPKISVIMIKIQNEERGYKAFLVAK